MSEKKDRDDDDEAGDAALLQDVRTTSGKRTSDST
jgi:hypothetical protein